MKTFFYIVGFPLRLFLATLVFVVGSMVNPNDKIIRRVAIDILRGRG